MKYELEENKNTEMETKLKGDKDTLLVESENEKLVTLK